MSITPAAIQQLLDELEASKRSRQRAWEVLQELRGVLSSLGNIKIEAPAKRTFDAEGAILKQVCSAIVCGIGTPLLLSSRTRPGVSTRRPLDRALIFHKRIKRF
jgi:hypothetical protein